MSEICFIDVKPRIVATGAETTVRLAGGGSDTPYYRDGQHYRAGVIEMPRFKAAFGFDDNGWTGGTVPTSGTLGFMSGDTSLIAILTAYYWRDAAITIDAGKESGPLARRLTGMVAGISANEGQIALTLSDPSKTLDKPILGTGFTGEGGIEGPAEAAGRDKRRSVGLVFDIEGRLLDKVHNIFEFGDPARKLAAFLDVRDKGRTGPMVMVAWAGSIAATFTALQAAAAPQGGCAAAPSIACVRWWTNPAGPLTADIQGEIAGGYADTAVSIAARLLAMVDGPTIVDEMAADALRPATCGIHIASASDTIAQALDRLLLPSSLHWVLQPDGTIRIGEWAWTAPVASLQADFIGRERQLPPVKSRKVGYRRNHRPHQASEISAALLLADDVTYLDGTPMEHLKPAESGATDGATVGNGAGQGNVKDETGNLLTREDLITREGISADTLKVAGVQAEDLLNAVATAQGDIDALEATYGSTEAAALSAADALAAATAAGGHATVSTNKANEAEGSRSAAAAEAVTAGNAAGVATAKAAAADLSASSAATSQIVSAAYASPRGLTPNADFKEGMALWYQSASGSSAPINGTWYPNNTLALGSWENTAGLQSNLYSALSPINTGRKYKIRGRVYSNGVTGVIYIGATSHDANGAPIGSNAGHAYIMGWSGGSKSTGWHEIESEVLTGEGTVDGSFPNAWFRLGTKQVRLCAFLNYATLGATQFYILDSLWLEDVTDSVASSLSASIADSKAAIATDAASAAQASFLLTASISGNFINKNAGFDDYPSAAVGSLPGGWTANFGTHTGYRVADPQGGYAYRLPGAAGADTYLGIATGAAGSPVLKQNGWYVVEADCILNSGAFTGAGALFYALDSSAAVVETFLIPFVSTPDQTGTAPGVGVAGKPYQFRKLVQVTHASAFGSMVFAMSHFSSLGSVAAANDITWLKCGARAATPAEIRDQTVLAPLEATVSTVSGAIAEMEGRTRAYLQQEVNAGAGAAAFLTMQAETNNPSAAPLTLVLGPNTLMKGVRGVIKNGGTAWTEGARSVETYTGSAYASFTVTNLTDDAMVGLSDHPTALHYSEIDFAAYKVGNAYSIYESGTGIGTYTTQLRVGDTLSVEYSDTTVVYRWNGKAIRTVATTAGRTFRLTTSLYQDGANVDNLVFGPTAPVRASTVGIGAGEVHIFNEVDAVWKKTVSFAGGNALFDGNISVGGGIFMGDRAIPVALQSFDIQVYDGLTVAYGASLGNIPLLTPDFSSFPALPAGQSYVMRAESHTPTGFIARVKKLTAGTAANQVGPAGSNPGSGPTFQSQKPTTADASDSLYKFAVSGTMYRNRYNDGDPLSPIWVYYGWIKFQTWFRPAGSSTWIAGPVVELPAGAGTLGNAVAFTGVVQAYFGTPLGQDATNTEFGISIHSTYPSGTNTLTGLSSVSYTTYAGSTESTATPGNLPLLPVKVIPQNV